MIYVFFLLIAVVGICIYYSIKHAYPLDDDDEEGDK